MRDDVQAFSRLQEVGAMRMFADLLRSRVGSPLSLASIARDLRNAHDIGRIEVRAAAAGLNGLAA